MFDQAPRNPSRSQIDEVLSEMRRLAHGSGDLGGIDLVAHRNSARGDDAVAIQCHCCNDHRLVTKGDIGSFLATSGSARFGARMLIHTAKGFSADLQRQIDDTDARWDCDDEWDWDEDEPPRRTTARGRGRRSSWEADDDDYI